MKAMYNDIVSFAELERFMDQKLKNYSSGMQVRLAFSIAIRAKSDILLLDEVLAVGDSSFQSKCFNYFNELIKGNTTVVLVTHDMTAIQKFCNRALILDMGKVLDITKPSEAAYIYQELNFPVEQNKDQKLSPKETKALNIQLLDRATSKPKNIFRYGDNVLVKLTWPKGIKGVKNAGVSVSSQSGQYIFGANTILDNKDVINGKDYLYYSFEAKLGNGNYVVNSALFGDSDSDILIPNGETQSFSIVTDQKWGGMTFLEHEWADQ